MLRYNKYKGYKLIRRLTFILTLITVMTGKIIFSSEVNYVVPSNEEVGYREDGSGAFRTHCLESHITNDDPLMFPNIAGGAHLHVFFGNPKIDSFTTVEDLKNTNHTKCDGGILNKSAYWVPALIGSNGERLKYVDPLFYYKTGYHVPSHLISAPPDGLVMIAGDAKSDRLQSTEVIKIRCASWQSNREWFDPGDPMDHVSFIPSCPLNDLVEVRIVFPQCWNGTDTIAGDYKSHMAYPIKAVPPITGTGYCPQSHPVAIPEISFNFAIYVTNDSGPSQNWRFSSDDKNSKVGGKTLHADWINGWEKDIMATIVRNCLNPGKECMVGLLGNGKKLRPIILEN